MFYTLQCTIKVVHLKRELKHLTTRNNNRMIKVKDIKFKYKGQKAFVFDGFSLELTGSNAGGEHQYGVEDL